MRKKKNGIISFIILAIGFLAAAVFLIISMIKPSDTETPPPQPSSEITDETSSKAEDPKPPKPTYQFSLAGPAYLDDALFIGDSRTVGLSQYGGIENATFFTSTGLNVYRVVDNNESVDVAGYGKVTLSQLLNQNDFGKIYIMFGINELGYPYFENTIARYETLIENLKELHPDAVIYVSACIHVTENLSNKEAKRNNAMVNKLNDRLKEFADNNTVFYIDPNPVFDDENGNLASSHSGDGIHLYAKSYRDMAVWLCTKAIIKEQ